MRQLKSYFLACTLSASATSVFAGGLLTNTNQSIAFNRNFAREATTNIDGVYSNPAGAAFLKEGFHLSLNFQNIYQKRIINSGMTVPALAPLKMENPMALGGGTPEGYKEFVGKAAVPILPSFQAAYNRDKWSFQVGFGIVGGGGKASFDTGLGSFERPISLIPALLTANGVPATGYSVSSSMIGQQYIFGLQLGAGYKINKNMAVYGGARFNYVSNKYQGNISNISAVMGGNSVNLYDFASQKVQEYTQMATQAKAAAEQATATANATTNPAEKQKYQTMAQQYAAGAEKATAGAATMTLLQGATKDKQLDVTQTGWGITPIIGFHYKQGKWDIGTRFEFNTHLNIQNNTKIDDTKQFPHGVNTPSDIPALWTVGAQYAILPTLRAMVGYHHFFDKSAKMANDKQKLLKSNTQEFLAGMEWDITDKITISAGGQSTRYGLGNGSYLTDLSFVTSSYSLGFGAEVRVAKNMKLNVAYFFTNYENFKKEYTTTYAVGDKAKFEANNVDDFTRTNKALGVGLNIEF